jgi:hypothetical protein
MVVQVQRPDLAVRERLSPPPERQLQLSELPAPSTETAADASDTVAAQLVALAGQHLLVPRTMAAFSQLKALD